MSKRALEFCINNVNPDVSYVTYEGEDGWTRLTPEQYELIEERIRAIIDEIVA